MMKFFVYILFSERLNKFYIGSCADISTRLSQHNRGINKSTKAGVPWVLKYTELYDSRAASVLREIQVKKKKSRIYIEWLISSAG